MTAPRVKKSPRVLKPTVDALDIVEEMTAQPTLNRFFDNNPESFNDEELMDLIATNRRNRAMVVDKKEEEE